MARTDRTDIYLDAVLRRLGAAYYESLHGRAARSDVTRALDTVEEHLEEHLEEHPQQDPQHPVRAVGRRHAARRENGAVAPGQHRRWARRVRDVMSTSVVTVDRITPYQEIARLLTEHRISGVPVLTMGRHVAGVVSEADLIAAEDNAARRARMDASAGRRHQLRRQPHAPLTAGALMTAPAITIYPDATIPAAARVMTTHHVRRLPVVDPDGRLIGSRPGLPAAGWPGLGARRQFALAAPGPRWCGSGSRRRARRSGPRRRMPRSAG
jgi:CBS domain-containing protein